MINQHFRMFTLLDAGLRSRDIFKEIIIVLILFSKIDENICSKFDQEFWHICYVYESRIIFPTYIYMD